MALLSSLLNQLRTVLPGLSSRGPFSAQHQHHYFHPRLEPFEPRSMLSANPAGLFLLPTAAARVAQAAPSPVTVAVFNGTYRVNTPSRNFRFLAFDVTVSDGQITGPSEFEGAAVENQMGQVTLTHEGRAKISAHVQGQFDLFRATADGGTSHVFVSFRGSAFFFRNTNQARGSGFWNATTEGGTEAGGWKATRLPAR
jgi:hypothetical protein